MLRALPSGMVPGRSPGARRGHRGHGSGRPRLVAPAIVREAGSRRSEPPVALEVAGRCSARGYDPAHDRTVRTDDQGPALDPARGPAGRAPVVWMLAGLLGHVLFLFLTAAVIAFLLNPLVRDLQRIRLPRGLAVALVFLLFAAAVTFVVLALGSVVVDQTRSATDRIDDYVTVDGHHRPDRGGAGHRPAAGVARHPRPRANPDPGAGDRLGRQSRRRRDLRLHPGRDLVRTGCRVLDRGDPLQSRPDRGDRDLHAARHAAARGQRSTAGSRRATVCR